MCEAIDVSRSEDEATAQLKRIHPQFVLMMPRRLGAIAALEVVAASKMQQVGGAQIDNRVRLALFVHQQGKSDFRFFPENPRIVAIAKANRGERSAFIQEGLFVFAQLRDVLPAENSAVVPKKNDHCRLALPQRTQAYFLAIRVGENDMCKTFAEGFLHAE